jgi:hypothetical protein
VKSDDPIKRIPIKDLLSEDSAHDLATSPEMRPYLRLAMAALRESDGAPNVHGMGRTPAPHLSSLQHFDLGFSNLTEVGTGCPRLTPTRRLNRTL